ncbi:MAG: hypothetical protein M3P83_08175 [Actinomycetota bacterium]|nr:hypothetical protein [Actinomycetota bacterium]
MGRGEPQLFGGAARGRGLRGAVLVLPQPHYSVGSGRQLGEEGEQLRVLVAPNEAGRGQQRGTHERPPRRDDRRLVVHTAGFMPLGAEHERKAVNALVALLVPYLRDPDPDLH